MTNKRILYYDVLSVVSCALVVARHCNDGYEQAPDQWWWLHVLVEVVSYNAVSIFFMLSGATLLGYRSRYSTRTFFSKRLRKAVLPFVSFTLLFYALYAVATDNPDLSSHTVLASLFSGRIPFTNYWFFVPLFLLYLFMPFLSVMVTNLSSRQLLSLIVLMVLLQGIASPVTGLVGVEWDMPMSGWVTYLLLGYYLSHCIEEQDGRVLTLVCVLGLMLMAIRCSYIYLSCDRQFPLWLHLSLYGYVTSAAIFLLAKRYCQGSYVNKLEGGGKNH